MIKTGSAILLVFSWIAMAGCVKDTGSCTPKTVQSEQATMIDFEVNNGINAMVHSSGLHYEIIDPGSGTTPDVATSTISVTYTGKLLNGTVFDQKTTPFTYKLNGFIPGWQYGIPLIKKGGTIKLIIPSSLAYGCTGAGSIPPDSVLYFEITLVDVF